MKKSALKKLIKVVHENVGYSHGNIGGIPQRDPVSEIDNKKPTKVIGVYAGRFQPPHRGHFDIYKQLRQVTGNDTFIATSDKVELPDSPLNFQEKQQIWAKHGVPSSNIVKVKSTYKPDEVTSKFDANNTAAIFAVGAKDVERFGGKKTNVGGKEVWIKADGSPGFFQPYKGNEKDMKPLKEHGYMWVIPQPKLISIGNKRLSGTVAREILSQPQLTDEQRRKAFQLIFGWFDIGLYEHLVDKFTEARGFSKPVKGGEREKLKEVINQIISELVPVSAIPTGGDGESAVGTSDSTDASQRSADVAQARKDAMKAKAQAERDLKSLEADRKWKDRDVLSLKKDKIPNKRKEIDTLNKQISGDASSADLTESIKHYLKRIFGKI